MANNMSEKIERMKLRRVTKRDINEPSTSKDTSSDRENDDLTSLIPSNSDQSNSKAMKRSQLPVVDDSLADFKSPKLNLRSNLAPNTVKLLEIQKNPPKKRGKPRASNARNSKKKSDANQMSIETSFFKPPTAFVCPLCLKSFNDSSQQITHSKNCAAKNNISTKKLIAAVQLHERQAEERAAIGLPAAPLQQTKKKAPNLKKLKSNDDPDVELAIALSKSLSEAQEIAELDEAMALASEKDEKFCEMSSSQKRRTLVNFGFSTNKLSAEINSVDKQPKRKKMAGPTVLQTRTEEVRNRLLAERIAEVIVDNVAVTQRTFSKVRKGQNIDNTEFKSDFLKKIYRSDSVLWNGSACERENEFYYVKGLCEFIKPVNGGNNIKVRDKRESEVFKNCVNEKSVENCDNRQENLSIESSFSNKSNEINKNQQESEVIIENDGEIGENRHENTLNNKNEKTINCLVHEDNNDFVKFNYTQRKSENTGYSSEIGKNQQEKGDKIDNNSVIDYKMDEDDVHTSNIEEIGKYRQGKNDQIGNNSVSDYRMDEDDGHASNIEEIGMNRQENNALYFTIKDDKLSGIDVRGTLVVEKLSPLALSWREMINSSACSDVIIFVKHGKFIFSHYVVLWSRCHKLENDFIAIDKNRCDMELNNLAINPKFMLMWENIGYDAVLIFLEFIYCACVINRQALKDIDVFNDVKNLVNRYQVDELDKIINNFEVRIQESRINDVDNQMPNTYSTDSHHETSTAEAKREEIEVINYENDTNEVMCGNFVNNDVDTHQNDKKCSSVPEMNEKIVESKVIKSQIEVRKSEIEEKIIDPIEIKNNESSPIIVISEDECDAELAELQLSINNSYKTEVLRASYMSASPDIFDGMDSMNCSVDNTIDKEEHNIDESVLMESIQVQKSLQLSLPSTSFAKSAVPTVDKTENSTNNIILEKQIQKEMFLQPPLSSMGSKKSSASTVGKYSERKEVIDKTCQLNKYKDDSSDGEELVDIAVKMCDSMSIRQISGDSYPDIRDVHVTKRKTFAMHKNVRETNCKSEEDDNKEIKNNAGNDEKLPTEGIAKLRNNLSLFIEKIQRRNERFMESDTDEDDSLVINPQKRKNPFKKRTSDDDSGLACKFRRKNLTVDGGDEEKKQYGGREKFIKRKGNSSKTDCEVKTALSLFEDEIRARVATEKRKNEGNSENCEANDENLMKSKFIENYDSDFEVVDGQTLEESNENSKIFRKTLESFQISRRNDVDLDSFDGVIDENWSKIEESLEKRLEGNREIRENPNNISSISPKKDRKQINCRNNENISVKKLENCRQNSENFSSIDFDDFTENEENANESMYTKYMKTHRENSIDKYRSELNNYFSEQRGKISENSKKCSDVKKNEKQSVSDEETDENSSLSLSENLAKENSENSLSENTSNNQENCGNDEIKKLIEKTPEKSENHVKNRRISMINQRHLMELSSFDLYECEEPGEEQNDPENSENSQEMLSPIDLTQSSDDEKTSPENSPGKYFGDNNLLENEENLKKNDEEKLKSAEKCREKTIEKNFNSIDWTDENDFNQSEHNQQKVKENEEFSLVATENYDFRLPQFNLPTKFKDVEENSFSGTPTVTEDVSKILYDCGILTSFTENKNRSNTNFNKTIADILSPIVLSSDSECDAQDGAEVNDIPDDLDFEFGSNFYHDDVNNDNYEHNDFGVPDNLISKDGATGNSPENQSFDEFDFTPGVFEGGADINYTNNLEKVFPSTSSTKPSTQRASVGNRHLSYVGNESGHLPLPKTPNKLDISPARSQKSRGSTHSLSTNSDDDNMAEDNAPKLLQIGDKKMAGKNDNLKLRRFSSVSPEKASNVRLLKDKSVSEGNFPSPRRRSVPKKSPKKVSICKGKEEICKYLDLLPSEVEISFDVPPKEDFDKLSSPELNKRLAEFGLKNQKRHRAVKLLNFIYEQMYPLVPKELVPTDWLKKHEACGLNTSQSTENPMEIQDGGDSDDSIKEPYPIQNQCLEDMEFSEDDDDIDGANNDVSAIESLKQNFKKILEGDTVFHRKILMYEPISLDIFVNKMEKMGAKVKSKILIDFLNNECISFFIDAPKKWSGGIRKQRKK